MKFKVIIVVWVLALISVCVIGCDKKSKCSVSKLNGVVTYNNSSTPKHSKSLLELTDSAIVNLDSSYSQSVITKPVAIDISIDGNLYILDYNLSKIFVFSSKGEYLFSFGAAGQGPGEFQKTREMMIMNNIVYISDVRQRRVATFSLDGTFLNFINLNSWGPKGIHQFGGNCIVGQSEKSDELTDGTRILTELSLYDTTFVKTKAVSTSSNDMIPTKPFNPLQNRMIFCTNNTNLYLSNIYDSYVINVFDKQGVNTAIINKSARQIKSSKQYVDNLSQSFTVNDSRDQFKVVSEYRELILDLQSDKNDQLWVNAYNDSSYYDWDVFKRGEYLANFRSPYKYNRLYLRRDKIILFFDNSIKIYDYSLKLKENV